MKSEMNTSRREVMQIGVLSAAGFLFTNPMTKNASAQDDLEPLNRFPRMVQEYFVDRVTAIDQANKEKIFSLKKEVEARAYIDTVQRKIQKCFGAFPEKTPLNPRITNVLERDTYFVENLIFESRPGFFVTANLYIPKGRDFPLPGVVGTCGHSSNGKAQEVYQAFAQGLARQGYVVLLYDPIGQGERLQYVNDELGSRVGVGVREHLLAGNQQFLVGENISNWRAWDGVRALDYLLSRQEVDSNNVGVTGNSGGGTMTTWLCGVEPRFTMGAPSCFVTTFLHNLENELPADTEQCPPMVLAEGLDHADFLAAMAPKPMIILAKERDYFDVRGSEEAYEKLKHLYQVVGYEDNIGLFVGPSFHGYSQENREAMYRWFNDVTQVSDAKAEPEIVVEKDEDLWCTPKGQVATEGSRTVFSFTQEKSKQLASERRPLSGNELIQAVKDVLRLPEHTGVPDYRIPRPLRNRQHPKSTTISYAIETESGIHAIVYHLLDERHYSRPPKNTSDAILYVSHLSSDEELRHEPLLKELIDANPNQAVFTCDVRGIGESMPNTCGGDFFSAYGADYFYAAHSIMLDNPYVGQKTFDVLRVLEWLRDNDYTNIHLAAKGWGALPATFAGLISNTVNQVTLKNALTSFSLLAETEEYSWPLSTLVPNILRFFDLPDCYKALENKRLQNIEPWGANPEIQ